MKYLAPVASFFRSFTRPEPARDWMIAVILTIIVGVGMVGAALYFYFGLETGAIIVPRSPEHVSPPAVSREALQQVLETYQMRAINYKTGNFVSE